MDKNKKYKSEAFEVIHEMISGCYKAGVIDKQTMRRFDETCLVPKTKQQSKRRMLVAQKRQKCGKDVLRRKVTFSDEDIYFWDWLINGPAGECGWFCFSPRQVGLIGDLPGSRQLTKPLAVNLIWTKKQWRVTEPTWLLSSAGPTIRKAVANFRRMLSGYLDVLDEPEDDPRVIQDFYDDIKQYFYEMTKEKQA